MLVVNSLSSNSFYYLIKVPFPKIYLLILLTYLLNTGYAVGRLTLMSFHSLPVGFTNVEIFPYVVIIFSLLRVLTFNEKLQFYLGGAHGMK